MMSSGMKYGIVDSGTSLLYLTSTDYSNFEAAVVSAGNGDSNWLDCTSQSFCYSETQGCSYFASKLSNIDIRLGNVVMTIPPVGYLVDGLLGFACVLAISDAGSNNSPYVFGDTFMRNFYVTFNYDTEYVSFAVSSNAPSGVSIKKVLGLWEIISIVAGSLVAVIIIISLVCYCQRRKKATQIGRGDNIVYKERMMGGEIGTTVASEDLGF